MNGNYQLSLQGGEVDKMEIVDSWIYNLNLAHVEIESISYYTWTEPLTFNWRDVYLATQLYKSLKDAGKLEELLKEHNVDPLFDYESEWSTEE